MKSKNNKAFRREHEQSLHDFEAGKDFLNETQKLLTMNKKKISLITLKLKPLLVKKLGMYFRASQVAQWVKNLPVVQGMPIQSPSWEDILEKGMATHSSILAWRIPWTEEPGRLQSIEFLRLDI